MFSSENANIVYFDLETSGFHDDEILQIAALSHDSGREFNIYVTPTKAIDKRASFHTGLTAYKGTLYLHNKPLQTDDLRDALICFKQFLEDQSEKPNILVAHNASFDRKRLIKAILDCNQKENFGIIAGFCDSLQLFKKHFHDRKPVAGAFKLSTLANDYLDLDDQSGDFHNALYDVKILKALSNKFLSSGVIFAHTQSLEESINHFVQLQEIADGLPLLAPLKSVVTSGILKKMSKEGLTYEILRSSYEQEGPGGLEEILKSKVTKRNTIIKNIIDFFSIF